MKLPTTSPQGLPPAEVFDTRQLTQEEQAQLAYEQVKAQNIQQQMMGIINSLQVLQVSVTMGIANKLFVPGFLAEVKQRCLQIAASTEDGQ